MEAPCRAQLALTEHKYEDTQNASQHSEGLLDVAMQQELDASHASEDTQQAVGTAYTSLDAAESSLSSCIAQPPDEDRSSPYCSWEHDCAHQTRAEVDQACNALEQARADFERAMENRMVMVRRLEMTRQRWLRRHWRKRIRSALHDFSAPARLSKSVLHAFLRPNKRCRPNSRPIPSSAHDDRAPLHGRSALPCCLFVSLR